MTESGDRSVLLRPVVLGTAGHIDHGKTALVRALTGVDTDRLKEERERGMTIDLGFAALDLADDLQVAVVDVPGHEDLVRTMIAGASGVDMVLLVVAADEGPMPQTREHLDIVRILGVGTLLVALSKADRVDPEWLELARGEVASWLCEEGFDGVSIVPTSTETGLGIEALREAIADGARSAVDRRFRDPDDLLRLPVDRSFTMRGTGTVLTGTVRSGSIGVGDLLRLVGVGGSAQAELDVRVRRLQVHGRDRDRVRAGERAAVAVAGPGLEPSSIPRGAVLVSDPVWESRSIVDVLLEAGPPRRPKSPEPSRAFEGSGTGLRNRDRIRVLHDTREVMARVILEEERSDGDAVVGSGAVFAQLRLEAPLVARAGDRLVLRRYSPVRTIGGARVLDPFARKSPRVSAKRGEVLFRIARGLDGRDSFGMSVGESVDPSLGSAPEEVPDPSPDASLDAVLNAIVDESVEQGIRTAELPLRLGLPPAVCRTRVDAASKRGSLVEEGDRLFAVGTLSLWAQSLARRIDDHHTAFPEEAGLPLAGVRSALPTWTGREFERAVVESCLMSGACERVADVLRRPGHEPSLPDSLEALLRAFERRMAADSGLLDTEESEFDHSAPDDRTRSELDALAIRSATRADVEAVARVRLQSGRWIRLDEAHFVDADRYRALVEAVRSRLGGRSGLGPAEFREVVDVKRKTLIALLNRFDADGVTDRSADGRSVPHLDDGTR